MCITFNFQKKYAGKFVLLFGNIWNLKLERRFQEFDLCIQSVYTHTPDENIKYLFIIIIQKYVSYMYT